MLGLRAYLLIGLCAAVPLAYGAGHLRGYRGGSQAEVARQAAAVAALRGQAGRR